MERRCERSPTTLKILSDMANRGCSGLRDHPDRGQGGICEGWVGGVVRGWAVFVVDGRCLSWMGGVCRGFWAAKGAGGNSKELETGDSMAGRNLSSLSFRNGGHCLASVRVWRCALRVIDGDFPRVHDSNDSTGISWRHWAISCAGIRTQPGAWGRLASSGRRP